MEKDIFFDLDEGVELPPPSVGYHPAILVGTEVRPNREETGFNLVLSFELAEDDPDRPGMPWTYYIPLPNTDVIRDFQAWKEAGRPKEGPYMFRAPGYHLYQAQMARVRKALTALGGPEKGQFDRLDTLFGRLIGRRVKLNLQPERDREGRYTGRLTIAFDGLIPA